MTDDATEQELQTGLRRLAPRELSPGLEDGLLSRLASPQPATAARAPRRVHWLAGSLLVVAAAAIVAAVAIWPPREREDRPVAENVSTDTEASQQGVRDEERSAQASGASGDRAGSQTTHVADGQTGQPSEIKDGQTPELDAKSQAPAQTGQSAAHAGEQAQSRGGARVGGFGAREAVEDDRESGASAAEEDSAAEEVWHRVAQGKFADVDVAKSLYERPGDKRFFLRVKITNKTDRTLGVQLDNASVIYPNQWGLHAVDHRTIIDERRINLDDLTEQQRSQLLRVFAAKELTEIRPRRSITYFRAFEGENCRAQAADASGYLIISLDGRLPVADGRDVDDLRCAWRGGDPGRCDLVIPCPVAWKQIPPLEIVVGDD
jgi:hypothetical protein